MSWLDVFRHGGPAPMSSEGRLPGFGRAIRARVSVQVLGDTIQPFPSFSEIQAGALKALRREIETARSKVSGGTR